MLFLHNLSKYELHSMQSQTLVKHRLQGHGMVTTVTCLMRTPPSRESAQAGTDPLVAITAGHAHWTCGSTADDPLRTGHCLCTHPEVNTRKQGKVKQTSRKRQGISCAAAYRLKCAITWIWLQTEVAAR